MQYFPDDDREAVDIRTFSRRLPSQHLGRQPVVDGITVCVVKHAAIAYGDVASANTHTHMKSLQCLARHKQKQSVKQKTGAALCCMIH